MAAIAKYAPRQGKRPTTSTGQTLEELWATRRGENRIDVSETLRAFEKKFNQIKPVFETKPC